MYAHTTTFTIHVCVFDSRPPLCLCSKPKSSMFTLVITMGLCSNQLTEYGIQGMQYCKVTGYVKDDSQCMIHIFFSIRHVQNPCHRAGNHIVTYKHKNPSVSLHLLLSRCDACKCSSCSLRYEMFNMSCKIPRDFTPPNKSGNPSLIHVVAMIYQQVSQQNKSVMLNTK